MCSDITFAIAATTRVERKAGPGLDEHLPGLLLGLMVTCEVFALAFVLLPLLLHFSLVLVFCGSRVTNERQAEVLP